MRYLSDFEAGQTYQAGPIPVEADEIIAFASRYDPQVFHLDAEAAEKTLFAGLAASGWLTASLTMRMLIESNLNIAGGMIGREVEGIGWPRPVRPGDSLRVVTEVIEVAPSRTRPDRGTMRIRTDTFNQNDELVQTMTARVMVPARVDGQG